MPRRTRYVALGFLGLLVICSLQPSDAKKSKGKDGKSKDTKSKASSSGEQEIKEEAESQV
jgi:hypothetical protein